MNPNPYEEILSGLDAAARANLSDASVRDYERRKAELIAERQAPDELELILRGWIWDEIEIESDYQPED